MTDPRPLIVPRPEVLHAPSTQHGALDFSELERLGLEPDSVLDFSVNSNPFGPSPKVREALQSVPLDRYPDREALALRRTLTERLNVSLDQIVVGNGTAELLGLIALAYIHPGDQVLIIGPTFDEYARAAALMGAEVTFWIAQVHDDFAVDPPAILALLNQLTPRLVFCCNPNNPTGTIIAPAVIRDWAVQHPHTLFVIDEAYLNFALGTDSALKIGADNILVLRSMTKDYALAGLRLGYAVGPQFIIDALARVRPPWNVNALAQAAGVAALMDNTYYDDSLRWLGQAKIDFLKGLHELGLEPLASGVHFFLVPVGNGVQFRETLLHKHIQVRDCTSFGLPTLVRIATRRSADNTRFLAAYREVKR
ncbi:MAG: histidinol-phosphate aminotransferase family protein [Chloroflexi bacterium]|nr:histidinol-phosphate aminotransferase family protein [Chloroflexota bacterium]